MPSRGFTLLEVIVAILVLSVGLLAYAASAAQTTRLIGDGRRMERAALVAWSELERLRGSRCPDAGSGTANRGAFEVAWAVWESAGAGSRRLQVVVRARSAVGDRAHVLATAIAC